MKIFNALVSWYIEGLEDKTALVMGSKAREFDVLFSDHHSPEVVDNIRHTSIA